jgi:hypothetical protein
MSCDPRQALQVLKGRSNNKIATLPRQGTLVRFVSIAFPFRSILSGRRNLPRGSSADSGKSGIADQRYRPFCAETGFQLAWQPFCRTQT